VECCKQASLKLLQLIGYLFESAVKKKGISEELKLVRDRWIESRPKRVRIHMTNEGRSGRW